MATTPASTAKPVTYPSCLECKARKVKCDRKSPCGSCVKRGTADQCKWTWNDGQADPKLLFKAVAEDYNALVRRLAEIEAALNSSNINLPGHTLPNQLSALLQQADKTMGTSTAASSSHVNGSQPKKRQRLMSSEEHADVDAELAARSLESFAAASDVPNGLTLVPAQGEDTASAQKSLHSTSILDATPRSATDSAYCDTVIDSTLSLDTALSQTRRDLAMESLLSLMPSPVELQYLYEVYLEKVHWRFRIINPELLSVEFQQYQQLTSWHRRTRIDPLWLAVAFSVFALALGSYSAMDGQLDPFQHHTNEQIDILTRTYHYASVKALYVGDFMGSPRVRTIQVVILLVIFFQQYLQPSAGSNSPDRMLQWLAVGVRTAQMLGLDKLGKETNTMPPEDAAWPSGCNAVKRQMALRLWMNLEWCDWMTTSSSRRAYIIDPDRANTKLVDNLNDDEVSASEWHIKPQSDSVLTSTAFEVVAWHIANNIRKTFDKSMSSSTPLSYKDTLELDGNYQKMLDELPLLRDDFDVQQVPNKYSTRQRYIALIGVHSQIARLHRPFLSQSYAAGSPLALSNERCLSSARKIVECHDRVKTMTSRGIFWFAYSHTFNAAIILLLDLFWSIDHGVAPALLDEKRNIVAIIQNIFSLHSNMGNVSLRGMLETGDIVIGLPSGLLHESDTRRAERQATHSTGLPSFADVVRKIVGAGLRNSGRQQALIAQSSAALQQEFSSNPAGSIYPASLPLQQSDIDIPVNPAETDHWEFPEFLTGGSLFESFPNLDSDGSHLFSSDPADQYLRQLMGTDVFTIPSRSNTPPL